jgi:hypothetical protein
VNRWRREIGGDRCSSTQWIHGLRKVNMYFVKLTYGDLNTVVGEDEGSVGSS